MKIGFFGNTNNFPLMIAQAGRELGHEVLLVVTSREILHRPESRYPEFNKGYPTWILDASHLSEWDFISLNPSIAPVLDALSTCDGLFLNDLGPSLWPLLRRPTFALLTGSDLSHYANFATLDARTAGWSADFRASAEGQMNANLLEEFIQRQREGIRQATALFHLPRGMVPESDAILDDIGLFDSKRIFQYFAEVELIKSAPAPHNRTIRIFCATRLTWKLPVEPGRSYLDYKGSDIMIRGLAQFYRETGVRLDIQLIKKGLHVSETKRLIAEQGLSDQVTWLDEMSLINVWSEFARCDIVIEQLSSSAIGMAGMDAMATGRPVIGNVRPEIFDGCFGQSVPICQAKTADEICHQLKRLVFDPSEREKLGACGRRFVEEHCNPRRATQAYIEKLRYAVASEKAQLGRNQSTHSYYLQRNYILQQTLQATQAELRAIQAEPSSFQSSPLIKLARKFSKLYKTKRSTD